MLRCSILFLDRYHLFFDHKNQFQGSKNLSLCHEILFLTCYLLFLQPEMPRLDLQRKLSGDIPCFFCPDSLYLSPSRVPPLPESRCIRHDERAAQRIRVKPRRGGPGRPRKYKMGRVKPQATE